MKTKRRIKCYLLAVVLIPAIIISAFIFTLNSSVLSVDAACGSWCEHTDKDNIRAYTDAWHSCVLDESLDLNKTADAVRKAIVNNEKSLELYVAVPKTTISSSDESSAVFFDMLKENVFDDSKAVVRDDSDNIIGIVGSYMLQYMSNGDITIETAKLCEASNNCDEYSYYYVKCTFKLDECKYVFDFVKRWSQEYIEDNTLISSTLGEEKNFYIIKTIYNYITKTTQYDFDLYNDRDSHTLYPEDSLRFKTAHSAFGAIFGNSNAVKNGADSIDYDAVYNGLILDCMKRSVDVQGLYRPVNRNIGLSVCDGYTYLFYCLSEYNGIDCAVVTGDYAASSGKVSDPHAWNMVRLGDKWYAVDTTFGSQTSMKISDDVTFVNYDYFMRGKNSPAFSALEHQQYDENLYSTADFIVNSNNDDYSFEIKQLDDTKLFCYVERRKTANANDVIENYYFIAPDGNHYKINDEKNGFIKSDEFIYNSNGYYYSYELCDYAKGVEYNCDDVRLTDANTYSLIIPNSNGLKISRDIVINPLDMSLSSSYSLSESVIANQKLDENTDITNLKIITEFSGAVYNIEIDISDKNSCQLVKGNDKDYTVNIYEKDNPENKTLREPGDYNIDVSYFGNYTGKITITFTISKADMSSLNKLNREDLTYGANISDYFLGTTLTNDNGLSPIDLEAGVDYEIVSVEGGTNYGDSGVVKVKALSTSKYLKENSTADWTYNITKQRDVSSVFNGKSISSSGYAHTGSPIEPDDFKLYCVINGSPVELINGVDYKINGYSNNINVGTANVSISFIGNFTGTANMTFDIMAYSVSLSSKQFAYNGKVQKPMVVVKNQTTGTTLTSGTDYTVSYSNPNSVNPGRYSIIVTFSDASVKPYTTSYSIYKNSDQAVVTLSATSYTYDGKVHKPSVTVKDKNGTALTNGVDYTLSYANASSTKAGTYSVSVNLLGDYSGQIIKQYKINPAKFTVSVGKLTYNGKTQTVSVSVKNGSIALTKGTHYTVSGQSATKPGAYVVKITGIGIYSGVNASAVYYIDPATLSNVKASSRYNYSTISWRTQPNCTYGVYAYDSAKKTWRYIGKSTGSSFKATKLYYNGKSVYLGPNKNYSFKVRAYYQVSVNGKTVTRYGAYKQVNTRTVPKTPAISKFTKTRTSLTARWKRDTAVTGYQVQLSTSSKFSSGNQTKTITKNSTLSTTFKSLRKGKTYYVRIRSYKNYNKVNYYSSWSSIYKIKL